MNGIIPEFVDHIDGNRGNNSWDNLRECSKAENVYNRVVNKNSSSGIKGISFISYDDYLYVKARVTHKRKQHVKLFRYTTSATKPKAEEQAIGWLESKRQELHKEFTNHG